MLSQLKHQEINNKIIKASLPNVLRSILFSKLKYNISKGHFLFASELLKTQSENQQSIGIEANANEIATNSQMWLQLETNIINKKFLKGKSPLIICSYIRENHWCMSLTRLLIENGDYLSLKDTNNGCNPLHYACAMLKCDQIELYIKHLNYNFQTARDFNGNTPLIYFMISFSFYFNRISSPSSIYNKMNSKYIKKLNLNNSNINSKDLERNGYLLETEDEFLIRYKNSETVQIDNNKIYESTENFQIKLVKTLKIYLDYLQKLNLDVNTMNRLGYNVYDFYIYLIKNNKRLEMHEFFQLIKNSIIADEYRLNLKQQKLQKIPTSSLYSQNSISKSSYFTSSQSNINQNELNHVNFNEFRLFFNQYSSNNNKTIPKFVSARVLNYSYNYHNDHLSNTVDNVKGNSNSLHLEKFLKINVLINLNDMRLNKLISHSKKTDENLLHLFLNKKIRDEYVNISSISLSSVQRKIKKLDSKISFDDQGKLNKYNKESNSNFNFCINNNWRDFFTSFYDHLIANQSTSYRNGAKIIYDSFVKVEVNQLSKANSKLNSSSQNLSKCSKSFLVKSLSVSSSNNKK